MNRTLVVAVGVVGVVATLITARVLGMSAAESWRLAAVSGGGAVLTGAIAASSLLPLRRRRMAVQVVVVALSAVAAVGAGTLASARVMMLSGEALHALVVSLVAGATVGVVAALALGIRVGEASLGLSTAARRMGAGELSVAIAPPATSDLAALARELEEMSASLADARQRERALDASRRELVAWVSHDLRTPLAGIRAMAEALEDSVVEDPEIVARYYKTLRVEADRLAELVDDLFELSRVQSGALRLHLERASLEDLVSDAVASARPIASAKGVRVEGRVDSPIPALEVSTPEVARALRNLLENAIRHTPSDATVWVEAGVDGDVAYVSVADACGGIPDPDLDRVFDLAFRGQAARSPNDGGAGLGLAIAKGIVDAHRGDISVANERDGCRFTVRLPLPRPMHP